MQKEEGQSWVGLTVGFGSTSQEDVYISVKTFDIKRF